MKPLVLRVPLIMLWGDGLTVCPWLVLIRWEVSELTRKHLIPHELCHVAQMRCDGWLRFWWSYVTNQSIRLAYETCAYKVSIANGLPLEEAARMLTKYYILNADGSPLSLDQAKVLLQTDKPPNI